MKLNYYFFGFAYSALIISSFVLPYFSLAPYTITANTLSELGAQQTPNAWMMNIVFLMLSGAALLFGYQRLAKKFPFQWIVILIFCIALGLSAVYRNAPIDITLPYNSTHHLLHSFFSTITGVSFCIFTLSLSYITKQRMHTVYTITMSITVILLSYGIIMHSEYRGIYHRILFILVFGWLYYVFRYYKLSRLKSKVQKDYFL